MWLVTFGEYRLLAQRFLYQHKLSNICYSLLGLNYWLFRIFPIGKKTYSTLTWYKWIKTYQMIGFDSKLIFLKYTIVYITFYICFISRNTKWKKKPYMNLCHIFIALLLKQEKKKSFLYIPFSGSVLSSFQSKVCLMKVGFVYCTDAVIFPYLLIWSIRGRYYKN